MQDSSVKIHFLGHTSIQIDAGPTRLIVDPNFGTRIPFLNRHEPAVFDPLDLHATDAVLFSNPRWNRMHHHSLKYFKQRRARLLLPRGTADGIRRFYGFPIAEMAENTPIALDGGITITALSVPHTSWRFFKRHDVSLCFLIRTPGITLFYGSDTTYDRNFFARVGSAHDIDAAILPIDRVGADLTAGTRFLNVTDALAAFRDLKADTLIPNAFGAFVWHGRDPQASRRDLESRVANDPTLNEKVKVLMPGQCFELKKTTSMGEIVPLKKIRE